MANNNPELTGQHSLSLKLLSDDYPDYIKPLWLTVKIEVTCLISELIDDGSTSFSPLYQVALPEVDLTVSLPLYEPNEPCEGKTNANVVYSVTLEDYEDPDLPSWASFSEEARKVKISLSDSEL